EPEAGQRIKELVFDWGDGVSDPFSWEFAAQIQQLLDASNSDDDPDLHRLLGEVLGGVDDQSTGVIWTESPLHEDQVVQRLTDTYTNGVIAALRDVRDEATRQMTSDHMRNTESR